MPPKRQILWLPLILAIVGIFFWFITILIYATAPDGKVFLIRPSGDVEQVPLAARWMYFVISGIFLLSLLTLVRWSIYLPVGQQERADVFRGDLVLFIFVVTVLLLGHFFFTVCA